MVPILGDLGDPQQWRRGAASYLPLQSALSVHFDLPLQGQGFSIVA